MTQEIPKHPDPSVQLILDVIWPCASFADAVCALRDGYDLNLIMRPWYRDAKMSSRVTIWPCADGALNGCAQVELVGRDIRACANAHPAPTGKFCKKCGAPVERRQEPVRWRVTQLPGYGEPGFDYHPERIPADAPVSERREVVEAWVDAWLVSARGAALAGGPVVVT